MDTFEVVTTKNPVKIQHMDAGGSRDAPLNSVASDDDEKNGLGYQNTLVIQSNIEIK